MFVFSFSHCVGGMWATREMDENVDKEIFVRTTIRELVIYLMFLVILGIGELVIYLMFLVIPVMVS